MWVLEGRNVLGADFDGQSDPYAIVRVGDKECYKSTVIASTLNPVWGESGAVFTFAAGNVHAHTPTLIQAYIFMYICKHTCMRACMHAYA